MMPWLRPIAVSILYAFYYSLVLGALEVAKAMREATWAGFWIRDYPGWWAAVGGYFVSLLVVASAISGAARKRWLPFHVTALFAAWVVWTLLLTLRSEFSWSASLFVYLLLLAAWIPLATFRRAAWGWAYVALGVIVIYPPVAYITQWQRHAYLNDGLHPDHEVVFIVSDALRADVCSVYGGPVPTPNLERLAGRGTTFTNAIAPSPWTLPSMYSVAQGAFHPLPENRIPSGRVPSWLPDEDHARYYVANWLLGGGYAFVPGRDDVVLNSLWPEHHGFLALAPLFEEALSGIGLIESPESRPLDTSRVLLREFAKRDRYELAHAAWYLHFMDPHDPYAPPGAFHPGQGHRRFFAPAPARDWGTKQLNEERKLALAPEERAEVRALYEAEVIYLDHCVGLLLQRLRNDGMLDRTTIVFLGDHGEELWDHGGFYHGHTLYQEQLHVPLIVAGPEIAAQVVDTPVSLVDVVPALWEVYARRDVLGELEVPEHLAGRGGALADTLLEGAQLEAEPVFAYGTVPGDFVEHEYAVIDGGWKLIEHRDGVTCELYHLETDPKEQRDLCAEEPEKAAKLRALLDAWKAETPLRVEASENDEALERLEALGYL